MKNIKGSIDDYINSELKKQLLRLWDEGKIKLGQRVPMMKCVTVIPKSLDNVPPMNPVFADLSITQELIQRLRIEQRMNWDDDRNKE